MKRFHFQLDPLLRLKRQQLRQAEMQLAAARSRHHACQRRWRDLHGELDRSADQFSQRGQAAPGAADVADFHRWIETLRGRIAAAGEQLTEAAAGVQRALQQRQEIATEVEGIETLGLDARRRYNKEVQHHRQMELDEFIMRGWPHPQ